MFAHPPTNAGCAGAVGIGEGIAGLIGGVMIGGGATLLDVRQGLLSAGGSPWTGAFVFAIALVLLVYLSRAAMVYVFERFHQSRLYCAIVDQDALNDLLGELDDDTENDDAE